MIFYEDELNKFIGFINIDGVVLTGRSKYFFEDGLDCLVLETTSPVKDFTYREVEIKVNNDLPENIVEELGYKNLISIPTGILFRISEGFI